MQSACAVLYSNLCLHYFSTLSHKRHDFQKRLLNIKCVFRFALQGLSETFLILKTIVRHMVINVYCSSCEVPVILVRFKRNLNFLERCSKNTEISNFMKIRPVGTEMFHENGRKDRRMGRIT